jgi:hypothetical protein
LKEITIPVGVTAIGERAFAGCFGLTEIAVPNSVTSIGESAFRDCSKLTSITLPFVGAFADQDSDPYFGYIFGARSADEHRKYVPDSLKTVVITGGSSIGYSAFSGCSGLVSITLPESVTSISEKAFSYCSALAEIMIPESVTAIDKSAFYKCVALTKIVLPNGVTSIGESAFYNCSNLMNIQFMGTKAAWNTVSKGLDWNFNVPATEVICSDGTAR